MLVGGNEYGINSQMMRKVIYKIVFSIDDHEAKWLFPPAIISSPSRCCCHHHRPFVWFTSESEAGGGGCEILDLRATNYREKFSFDEWNGTKLNKLSREQEQIPDEQWSSHSSLPRFMSFCLRCHRDDTFSHFSSNSWSVKSWKSKIMAWLGSRNLFWINI